MTRVGVGNMEDERTRCSWSASNPIMMEYHDKEWGVVLHDDYKLFEFLTLEGAQAGLSWLTVLNKREAYREAFDNFDFRKVAHYDERKVEYLLEDSGIIRNRLKIKSAIINAKAIIKVRAEFGTFDNYIWQFVSEKAIKNNRTTPDQIPATSQESDIMSKDLTERGFKFVGSTICYSHMQATGMVNDHLVSCFRHDEV